MSSAEQIAHGVPILGAVQPMNRFGPAGIRPRGGGAIDLGLEPGGEGRSSVAASGRGMPAGGMAPVRSLRTTFSQVSAPAGAIGRAQPSSTSPPLFSRSLWHDTQYRLTIA